MYQNAPVVFVALEMRHPSAGTPSPTQQRKIKQQLGATLPILRTGQIANIQAVVGDSAPTVHVEKFPKFFSRDGTLSVAFLDSRVVVETTRYEGWAKLRAVAAQAARARQGNGDIDGIERVGLRYINEVRVPGDIGTNWEPWVNAHLLGAKEIGGSLGLSTVGWQGVTVFSQGSEYTVVLRYGPADGYAVDPGGDLKRPIATAPGPYFLIDIDSAWAPSKGVPEFDAESLRTTVDEIHRPVDELFESLITERLREEVLRRAA